MSALAAPNVAPQIEPPVVTPETPLDEIAAQFFRFDCVKINNLLPPTRLGFFRSVCEKQYVEDDAAFERGDTAGSNFLRQFKNGWIWENRLAAATGEAFSFTDIVASRRLYQILDRLMGPDWKVASLSQIRRAAPEGCTKHWGSPTTHHFDAQWGNTDQQFSINVWVPLTPAGRTASSLEFLLNDASSLLKYSRYDPSTPMEPAGPGGINPRFDYNRFMRTELNKHFTPEQFWFPECMPGDVILFSHWSPHATRTEPGMTDIRISLEWRVRIPTFDTLMRPAHERMALDAF